MVWVLVCCVCLHRRVLSYAPMHLKLSCVCNRSHNFFSRFFCLFFKQRDLKRESLKTWSSSLSEETNAMLSLCLVSSITVSLLCLPSFWVITCFVLLLYLCDDKPMMWKCAGADDRHLSPRSVTCAFVCLSLSCLCVANYQRRHAE